MVTSMRDVPEDREYRREGGMSAREAADQLVYEIRRRGIPAYTFTRDERREQIETKDRRTGETRLASFIAEQDQIVIFAGNYDSTDAKGAKVALEIIKKYEPSFMNNNSSGLVFRRTPGRPKPLARAFMTLNPLLSADDVKNQQRDPLLVQLNSGRHSLLTCPGKYTLVVASYYGHQLTSHESEQNFKTSVARFDMKIGSSLDNDALKAWKLTDALRNAKRHGYSTNFEAFVWHDRHKSLVTIGAFDNPKDPAIVRLARQFAGKLRTDPRNGTERLTGEVFSIPRVPKKDGRFDQQWVFNPSPMLMEVPRMRR